MWQISGPPATVAPLCYYIFGYLHDFGPIAGLLISIKWTNLESFEQFSVQMQIERGSILCQKCQLIYFVPYNAGHFGGVCQLAQFGPISRKKSKLKGGPFYKEIANSCI